MAPPPDDRPALVIGCGYLGRRVAAAWRDRGRQVAALSRGRAGELAADGFEPVVGDVLDPASLAKLPEASTVLYAVGLDRTAGRPMRDVYVTGLANVLAALPQCGRFLYVSSTSVYGQTDGSVVTEESPTEPATESGRVVLDAERLLRERLPAAVVLRLAGICGPGRLLRRQALLQGREPLAVDPDQFLNLIHVDDGVRAVLAAEERAKPGETYLVADGTPVRRGEFYAHLARLLGAPEPRYGPPEGRDGNRRVSNRKAREELGFVPVYPSYVEGLAALL